MNEPALRRKLLQSFYDRRLNPDGWCPTSDIDASGGEYVTRQEISNVCEQLADYGLIHWKALTGKWEGFTIGFAKITGAGVDIVDGVRPPPIAIDGLAQPRPGIDMYKALVNDAKAIGPKAARLVETVGRKRAEIFLVDAVKKQQTESSFVKNSQGQNVLPRDFYTLVEADLRAAAGAAISDMLPKQILAPVRVEERDGKLARISDRDGALLATDQDFDGWRQPALSHIKELLFSDFKLGTNHSRARDRLLALEKFLQGTIEDVQDRQFTIGYEVDRLEGLIKAYRSSEDDMPILNGAILEDLDRLRLTLLMGLSKLTRWNDFRRAALNDPFHEGSADPTVIGDALAGIAAEMEKQPNYFDSELPESFRFIVEVMKDFKGAALTGIYGAVKSAENVFSYLGQKALEGAKTTVDTVVKHISKAVAISLLGVFSHYALAISGALPTEWSWLKPLLNIVTNFVKK